MGKSKRPEIPRFETPIIETHCHLDYLDESQLNDTLARSFEVGVERIITIAVSAENLQTVMDLTASHSAIWGTQGIHPHEAAHFCDEVKARIQHNALDEKILAIGEIGLDYHYDHAPRAQQQDAFEQQLQLACDMNLPVVIHTREADEDTRAILENFSDRLPRKGVIHSFTSSLALAKWCLGEGFALGFNGIATFNSAENVREVVDITPVDQILLETDAPYLTPVPYRGKANAPYYLPFIAQKIADIKDLPVESLLEQAYINSESLFFS